LICPPGEALVAQHPQRADFRALPAALAVFEHLDIARAGLAVFVLGALLGFGRPPEHQQFADVLDRRCIQFFGQGQEHRLAGRAVVREDPDLDQAMGIQRARSPCGPLRSGRR
jgi:hypothetical protein